MGFQNQLISGHLAKPDSTTFSISLLLTSFMMNISENSSVNNCMYMPFKLMFDPTRKKQQGSNKKIPRTFAPDL